MSIIVESPSPEEVEAEQRAAVGAVKAVRPFVSRFDRSLGIADPNYLVVIEPQRQGVGAIAMDTRTEVAIANSGGGSFEGVYGVLPEDCNVELKVDRSEFIY